MTGTALTHRAEAAQAVATGDPAGANAAYARELAALSGQEIVEDHASRDVVAEVETPAHITPAMVDGAFEAMAWWDDGEAKPRAAKLRARWGADAARNLAFADAFGQAHPDVRQILYDAGFGDHPVIVEIAAIMGRRYAKEPGQPARMITRKENAPMADMDDAAFDTQLQALRAKTADAQARGMSSLANRFYQEEQDLIATRRGSAPIVNGRRTA